MKTTEFYKRVKSRFSVLIHKYGFEPVFELEPAGPFNLSEIIFQSQAGLIRFDVEYRDLDVGIQVAFDAPTSNANGTFDYNNGSEWHHILLILGGLDIAVDYERLYKSITEKEWDAIVEHLLDNWAMELSPHWERIVASMNDPAFRQKIEEMKKQRRYQKIITFDRYGLGKSLVLDAGKSLLKNIPKIFGYIVSIFLGLLLVSKFGRVIPDNFVVLVALVPAFIFYLILRFVRAARQKQNGREGMR